MQSDNNIMMEEEDDEIDVMELLGEILSHWLVILVSGVLVGIIAFLISKFLISPQYESTSKLYVLSKSTSVTSLADIQLGSNLANDYVEVVASRPVLDQVISNLSLDEDYKSLSEKLSVNNPSSTRILEITVTDSDPVMAKLIADEIADVSAAFISEKMDQDPPSVLQYGYCDEGKVSPSIRKNTIIGFAAGIVFVMVIVIVSYLVNDTVATPDDVEKKLGLTLLGTLPATREEYNGKSSKKHLIH